MTRPNPIAWFRTHERAADVLFALLITSLCVAFHVLDVDPDPEFRDPTWWTTLVVLLAVAPIAWRRAAPIESGLVVVGAQLVAAFLDIDGAGFLGVIVALYSIGAHSSGPRRTRAVGVIAAATTTLFTAGLLYDELEPSGFISSTVILVTAFVVGDNLRRRRERADALAERAERAEREQHLIAEQRVNAERARIARELHDVVAHSVSVMVIQASAARRNLRAEPDRAEAALRAIEDTGRQTMNELRGVLGVLRQQASVGEAGAESTRLPQPTLDDLDALVAADAELPIQLRRSGSTEHLSRSCNLTCYRVVQEALTNVRRHAGQVDRVGVAIDVRPESVRIEVTDDGRGAAADERGPGYGIVGMRERVAAVGGTVSAGPQPGGGWRVVATIPSTPTAPGPPVAHVPHPAAPAPEPQPESMHPPSMHPRSPAPDPDAIASTT